jgi:replicative DNA helicase
MSLGLTFLSAVLNEGDASFNSALELGLEEAFFKDDDSREGERAYKWIIEHRNTYGALPKPSMLEGSTGVSLPEAEGTSGFYLEELRKKHIFGLIRTSWNTVVDRLNEQQFSEACQEISALNDAIVTHTTSRNLLRSLFSMAEPVKDYYRKIKSGERGVALPWKTLTEMTFGLWPEDLMLIAAKAGIGKTWAAIIIAAHAWRTGKKVLFITTEVSQLRIAMRFYSYFHRVPYDDFTHAKLSEEKEAELFAFMDKLTSEGNFELVGGEFDFKIESVYGLVRKMRPDMLIADGIYLFKVPGSTRTERMANCFDEMKRLAKREQIPVCITTQFNREAKKNDLDSVSADQIALSDTGHWNSDIVIGLLQTEEMKKDKSVILKVFKVREGRPVDVKLYWDFETMNFDEYPDGGGGGDADESDLGLPVSNDWRPSSFVPPTEDDMF